MTREEKIDIVLNRHFSAQFDPVWEAVDILMGIYKQDGDFSSLVKFLEETKAELEVTYRNFEDPTPWAEWERVAVREYDPDHEGNDGYGNEFQWQFDYTKKFRLNKTYEEQDDEVKYRLKYQNGNNFQDFYLRVQRTGHVEGKKRQIHQFLKQHLERLLEDRKQLRLEFD